MNKLMMALLGRLYREENDGQGNDLPGSTGGDASEESNIWADLSNGVEAGGDDLGDQTPAPDPANVAASEEATGGETPVPAEPAVAATGEALKEETPATPEAQPEVAEPTTPEAEMLTPEQLAQRQADYRKWVEAEEARLVQEYAVSEEDAAALATEPETVLPKLAAKLHMQVTQNVLASVQQMLPQAVQSLQTQTSAEQQAKDAFYKEWPELAGHESDVLRIGQVYRQTNPNAKPDQAVREIGELVMKLKGLSRQPKAQQTDEPAPRPHRPATGGGGNGGGATKPAAKEGDVDWASFVDD